MSYPNRLIAQKRKPSRPSLEELRYSMENKSSSANKLFQSLNKETRYCVLECAVFMEEKASETLGRLLGIDWKESESLGYGSASLGFDNKIRLIQDIKGITSQSKAKFQSFMAIRNKFAHVAEIDSFKNYFKLIKKSNHRKKELNNWFPNLQWDSDDFEEVYKSAFFLLTLDLFKALFDIDIQHVYEKGLSDGKTEAQEIFIESIKFQLEKTEEGKRILNETIEKIRNKKNN